MAITNHTPTKTTYIIESEKYNARENRIERIRIEVNSNTTIRDALIQSGQWQGAISGEVKIIYINSLI